MIYKKLIPGHMYEIRPKVIFSEIEKKFPNTNINFTVNIPTTQIGGLTLLESSILVSFVKLISPLNIFEFGTYMGATSVLFAENSSKETKITTLDIDDSKKMNLSERDIENNILIDDVANDNYLRVKFVKNGAIYINRSNKHIKDKIRQIYQNSLSLNPKKQNLSNNFDLIFIDGGHDYQTVKSDTENAMCMAKEDSIIVWHDYRSNIHSDVTTFLDQFCKEYVTVHIQNTMLAFILNGKYKSLIN